MGYGVQERGQRELRFRQVRAAFCEQEEGGACFAGNERDDAVGFIQPDGSGDTELHTKLHFGYIDSEKYRLLYSKVCKKSVDFRVYFVNCDSLSNSF